MITHGSTFSGIGAPEVAAEMLGWENVFHCEINPFGRKVLDYYFPKAKSYEDITRTDFSEWRDRITVLTGGFPCQPFSYAGKRRGSEDDRYLWPFMLRCIEQVRPRWFVGENVAGITTMAFPGEDVKVGEQTDLFGACDEVFEKHERYVLDEICQSLERAGYSVQPMLIPACAVGAPHRRDRVFIVAHRVDGGGGDCFGANSSDKGRHTTDTECLRHEEGMSDLSVQAEASSINSADNIGNAQINGRSDRGKDADLLPRHTSYTPSQRRREIYEQVQSKLADGAEPFGNGRERTSADTCQGDNNCNTDADTDSLGHRGRCDRQCGVRRSAMEQTECEGCSLGNQDQGCSRGLYSSELLPENRWRTFPSVSPVYRGNDGLPFPVDHLTIPFSEWKRESLKAYGNAIVPQVMYEIFRCIDEIEQTLNPE